MASNRNKFLPCTNLSTSSQITVLNDNGDLFCSSQIGDATGFFLGGGGGNDVPKFEFPQSGFPQSPLVESVEYYERHVFLCYKDPPIWPPHIVAAEFDRLPRLLSAAFLARKGKMEKQTRLTICEGHDGTETSNGDVLIFPDMIRYRRLTHFDVDTFVEEVLVKESEWLPGAPEALRGCFIFVCAHASRDRRCGVCGPAVITRFKEEIELNGLQGKVSVSPCSHIGGHKYAGNVIIFGSNFGRQVTGHWYGNVTPDDVPLLLEQHISKGEIVDSLWRGQMGLSEEDQKRSQEARIQQDGKPTSAKAPAQTNDINNAIHGSQDEAFSCCQMNANSCCQNLSAPEKMDNPDLNRKDAMLMPEKKPDTTKMSHNNSGKGPSTRKMFTMPTWFEDWEREDTYAALSVVVAALSVAFAYRCYKQLN